jgi:hypothetical protein
MSGNLVHNLHPNNSSAGLTPVVECGVATDNGPQFLSDTFKRYMEENGIVQRRITPLWPSGNGEIERQNRSLLKRMKIANAERKTWETELQTYLKMYRSTPHLLLSSLASLSMNFFTCVTFLLYFSPSFD